VRAATGPVRCLRGGFTGYAMPATLESRTVLGAMVNEIDHKKTGPESGPVVHRPS
jgi:hypothetical protein